ncbi:MAG: aminopeptidase [Cyanobacteria bacterium NC_groundwater_1444_Ag_S-0.65um_54_12]|nr:aminopeptidase [Cyanobacteria bacterium NC_groundwater_1444_Ag_S-0.65um_54_12]
MNQILRLLAGVFLFFTSSGCSAGYLLQQGISQLSLLLRQEPLDKAMERLPANEAAKLRLVREIKNYAVQVIGLQDTGSYERFVELKDPALSHVLSAAPKDRLEPYQWNFPVVGAVPYQGFFDKQDALAAKKRLEEAGLDVHLRSVAAFSLLGFFSDPFYSSMLGYSAADLSNIIIHELTHATVFITGNAQFNESFATYVGNAGSLDFLMAYFGNAATPVREARARLADDLVFSRFIQQALTTLRRYYARLDLTTVQKVQGRQEIFAQLQRAFETLPLHDRNYSSFANAELNNAYLLLFDTYQRDLTRFEQLRDRFASLRALVTFFRNRVAKQQDPETFLARWEAEQPSTPPGQKIFDR